MKKLRQKRNLALDHSLFAVRGHAPYHLDIQEGAQPWNWKLRFSLPVSQANAVLPEYVTVAIWKYQSNLGNKMVCYILVEK